MSDKATQVGLQAPGLAAVFHDEFKNEPNGEATLQQKIDIQDGKRALPAGAHVRFDCNPDFQPPITRREDGELIKYPSYKLELLTEKGDLYREATLGPGHYEEEGFAKVVGPDTPESLHNLSLGYAPMIVWFGQPVGKGQLRVTVLAAHLTSPAKLLPWVQHV